jgi:type I restriction enzyme S subunit
VIWSFARLDEVAKIVGGATPSTAVPDYWNGDILWATPADLSQLSSRYISDTPRRVTAAGLRSCAAEVLPANSLLLSSRAPIGHVAINLVPMATNQGFKSIVPDESKLHSGFMYWWLKANKDHLQRLGNGATFKEISKAVVSRIQIPIPPLDEQRRLAAILDQADDLRRKRRVALEKLNVLAGAIFFDLFGDPVQNLHKWPVKTLDKLTLGNPNNGIFKKNHEYLADARSGIPVVWVEDLFRGHKVGLTTARTLAASPRDVEKFGLRNGDILFCRSSLKLEGIAYTNVFLGQDNAALFECHIVRISPDREQVSPTFLNWQLRLPSVRNIAKQKSKTSTMTTIDQRAILSIPVVVPPISSQIEFERRLEAVFNAAKIGMKQLSGCDRLFVSLQHRAFHGQLLSSRPATALTV